jgi:large subunit ribosomal protein L24
MNVKKNDTVLVLGGKDRGKTGKILEVHPKTDKVVVEGVNMCIRHKKPRRQGQPGGRISQAAAIHASNVLPVCDKCDKATRVGHKFEDDGKKIRVCKKCGASLDA